jgi:hypothetical protein
VTAAFPTWTPIATRLRPVPNDSGAYLVWEEIPGAPITLKAAHDMEDAGELLMASRHRSQIIECVIMTPRQKQDTQAPYRHDGQTAVKYNPDGGAWQRRGRSAKCTKC